jgi:hypothetical protein
MLIAYSKALVGATLALAILNTTAFAASKTNQIQFAYEEPKERDLVVIYKDMKERRVLERLQEFLSPFRLPKPLKFTFRSCEGEDDAFYFDYDVTLCYELVEELQRAKPKKTTQDGLTPHDAVAGPFFSIALHEFAHAVFYFYNVPIFGREEDAADQLAAYIILLLDNTVASRLIKGAAYAFLTESKEQKSKSTIEYASEHGTAEQRYYNVLCLAFGADPKQFSYLESKKILPEDRADACQDEFEQIEDAYRAVILPHVDQALAKKVWGKLEVRTK